MTALDYNQYEMNYLVDQYELLTEYLSRPRLFAADKAEKIEQAFSLYDKDGSGMLDRYSASQIMMKHHQACGYLKKPTEDEVNKILDEGYHNRETMD